MPALEQAPISAQKSPVVRQENSFQLRLNKSLHRQGENRHIQPETKRHDRFTPLSKRLMALVPIRNKLLMLAGEEVPSPKKAEKTKPVAESLIKQPRETVKSRHSENRLKSANLNSREHLAKLAGQTPPMEQRPQKNTSPQPQMAERHTRAPVQLRPPPVKQPIRRHIPPAREARGIFEKAPPIKPVSIKSAEALIIQTTEAKMREPIPREEFKTLHPSERFFSKIPKLETIPHTGEQVVGSVPEGKIVAEQNMATPFEVYTRNNKLQGTVVVVRKLNPEALPLKLIKDDGEAQEVLADNGRDVTQTLAFQINKKYYQLKQTDDLVMRLVEITDKKQIAEVVAKKQEYARKNGFLPDRNKLRQNPGLEIQADQKKRDYFFTWHDMLNKIEMQSIQTFGKAHIICDKSLPAETASLFSRKFLEAYYSEKYKGLPIEERTKQIYLDILKELGLEKTQSVATYLVTRENNAYFGGKSPAKVTATYGDNSDETEPPEVFQPEQDTFQNTTFKIDGRTLVFDDNAPSQLKEPSELSPDQGIKLILQPEE